MADPSNVTRREPDVELTRASRVALFPGPWTRFRTNVSEFGSAVGKEGAWAATIYLFCLLVLCYGAMVTIRTWDTGNREFHIIPYFAWGPVANLSVYWFSFALAVGIGGWLLSGHVTKKWLRIFVGIAIAIAVVLLITIGRNARVDQATADARSEALRLLAAAEVAVDGEDEDRSAVRAALLTTLCEKGGLAPCEHSAGDAGDKEAEQEDTADELGLRCLQGWTVATFDEWMKNASLDRQIAALTALASCEINVVDPIAEQVAQESGAAAGESGAGEDGEQPADQQNSNSDSSSSAPEEPTDRAVDAVRTALQVQRSEVQAHEAISAGADELLTFASGPTRFAEFRFSGAAWLVVLAALLLWYRQLEIRAGEHRLGPVDVQFESAVTAGDAGNGDEGTTSAEARAPRTSPEAVFKESVIRNVPEPGAIPGGEALAPVGDLVAHSDVPQKWLVSGVIDAARTIFATKGGFTVIFSTREAEKGHVAFVRLRDTRTGGHLASYLARADTPEAAARRAGFWVAGWIISRSDYVPGWAQWSEEDARGFLRLPWVSGSSMPWGPDDMADPASFDPNAVNSMILAQRAYARQLFPRRLDGGKSEAPATQTTPPGTDDRPNADGRDHFAALEDFARAVNREPRYPVARYRRGAVLGTMMFRGGDIASAAGLPDDDAAELAEDKLPNPARLRYLFGDLILADRRRSKRDRAADDRAVRRWVDHLVDPARDGEFPLDMRRRMLELVAEWSNRNRAAVRWGLAARLRPSEQFFWKEFRRGRLERDWVLLLKSELCICAERLRHQQDLDLAAGPLPEDAGKGSWRNPACDRRLRRFEKRVRKRALKPDSHWQIAYNLACLHSIRSMRRCHEEELTRPKDPERADEYEQDAEDSRAAAMEWLERCLDRPASDQLVIEWVVADGDLKPLREEPEFKLWTTRLRSVRQTVQSRADTGAAAQV